MEFGICSFGDYAPVLHDGSTLTGTQRMQNLLEEIITSDQLGMDVYALGEHHRKDYLISAPAVVLAAAAPLTKNIRLSTGVTVLSSEDPVRVFEQFSTLDLISQGRAEIMAGRGSFIESFPLFGYDLEDYDGLFSEKLELLLKLNEAETIHWKGKFRSPLSGQGIYPRPHQPKIPVWIAVGGTPASAIRAGKLGLPLSLAIIGGMPAQFKPLIELYRKTYTEAGHAADNFQLSVNGHMFLDEDSQKAADIFFPAYAATMSRIGRERGWPALTRAQYEQMRNPRASLMVGSPAEIVDKILYQYELFGNTRFLAQLTVGALPHADLMRSLELFGTKVVPEVRKHLGITSASK